MSEKQSNPVSDRLARSRTVTVLVTIAAILGFLIATANGLYTIATMVSKAQHSPSVTLASVTLLRQTRQVNVNDFLGIAVGEPLENIQEGFYNFDPKTTWFVPYLHAQVVFKNPTDEPVSIIDCALQIRFEGDSEWHRSHAYAPFDYNRPLRPGGPIIALSAREAKKFDFAFYFIPIPKMDDAWSGDRMPGSLLVTYIDDRGNTGSTATRRFTAAELLK